MNERSFNSNSYRYGQNTQEKVLELGDNHYTADGWEYEARLGRRWNIDPVVKSWESGYSTFHNNPLWYQDEEGYDGGKSTGDYYASNKGDLVFVPTGKEVPKLKDYTWEKVGSTALEVKEKGYEIFKSESLDNFISRIDKTELVSENSDGSKKINTPVKNPSENSPIINLSKKDAATVDNTGKVINTVIGATGTIFETGKAINLYDIKKSTKSTKPLSSNKTWLSKISNLENSPGGRASRSLGRIGGFTVGADLTIKTLSNRLTWGDVTDGLVTGGLMLVTVTNPVVFTVVVGYSVANMAGYSLGGLVNWGVDKSGGNSKINTQPLLNLFKK